MDKLISQQAAIDKIKKRLFETAFNNVGIKQNVDETLVDVAENRLENWFDELPSAQPEPAIPLSWIEGQIKWLKSMDNAFATCTAEQISAMVNKWKDEQDGRFNQQTGGAGNNQDNADVQTVCRR